MTGQVTASTVANFDQTVNVSLSIEKDPGIFADGMIHLLLHPADPDISVKASKGDVFKGDTKAVDVPSGVATFGGGTQTQLPKRPVYSSPEFSVMFAFDEDGNDISASVFVTYDAYRNTLSISQPCTAAVAYSSYVTQSRKLTYQPKASQLSFGATTEYGVIAAAKAPNHITTYEVDPLIFVPTSRIELYRIVSDAVTTPDGEFEKPPNYPTSGAYPGLPSATIDVTTALLTERPHEIGYMDELGTVEIKRFYVPRLTPYALDGSYTIPTRCKKAVIPTNDPKFPINIQLKAKDYVKSLGLGCE